MEKRKKRTDKKLKLLLYDNGRLKARIVDYSTNEEYLLKKTKDLESLKDEMNRMTRSNSSVQSEYSSNLKQKDNDSTELLMLLARTKAEATKAQGEKEHLYYFLQESIKRIKKKSHHFDYAVADLSEKDLENVKAIFTDLGLGKYFN